MVDKDKSTVNLLSSAAFTVSCIICLISFITLNRLNTKQMGTNELLIGIMVTLTLAGLLSVFGTIMNDIIKAKNSRLLTKTTKKICLTAVVIQIITSISCGSILYKEINALGVTYLNMPIKIVVALSLIYCTFILIILMIAGTRKTNME